MIKFFRKIRQQLLSENKFSRYLTYAIGEIILVVIGILIALQINNWNEKQKEKALMTTNIRSIGTEIQTDLNNIKEIIRLLDEQSNAARILIPIMESKDKIIKDSLAFILDFNSFTGTPIISERSNTWDYLNASGVVSEFPDAELLKMLQEYYIKFQVVVTNFQNSANPTRLELRQLKYELFSDSEHRKFFPTKSPKVPSIEVYNSIFNDMRVLPLCRFIGSTADYFNGQFRTLEGSAATITAYIDEKYAK